MAGLPSRTEAAPYYYTYIDRVTLPAIVDYLASQLPETVTFLQSITEEQSLHRYAPDKWSIRQVLNHITDRERIFLSRAMWFARGFDSPLPSFDQNVAMAASRADDVTWKAHVEEFNLVRFATVAFFRNMPDEAWSRSVLLVESVYGAVAGVHHRGTSRASPNHTRRAVSVTFCNEGVSAKLREIPHFPTIASTLFAYNISPFV